MNFRRRPRLRHYPPPTPHSRRYHTVFRLRKWVVAPATPFAFWKFCDIKNHSSSSPAAGTGGAKPNEVSSRKLAATLWQLQFAAAATSGGGRGLNLKCGSCNSLHSKPGSCPLNSMFPSCSLAREYGAENKVFRRISEVGSSSNHRIHRKIQSCSPYSKDAMEGATKWDPTNDVYQSNSPMKLVEDAIAAATSIQAELELAQLCIRKLETEQLSFKKQIKHFMGKLGEERTLWRRRQQQKVRAVIYDLNNELRREKKTRKNLELLNSKLISKLADAELSAKKVDEHYEDEKKGRELMEEICNELAKRIAEDKSKIEALKMELIKMMEEMEEERKMLQIAEAWREERIQMKLIDAKLELEGKNYQMNKLIDELEMFLGSGSAVSDAMEVRKAELIEQADKPVDVKNMMEFSYMPPESGDAYSNFEQLRQIEATECSKHSPASDVSKIQNGISVVNHNDSQNLLHHPNVSTENNNYFDEDRKNWKSKSCPDYQDPIYSLEESESSINGPCQSKTAWQSAEECWTTGVQNSPNTQMTEACSASELERSLQKSSSTGKLQGICRKLTLDNAGDGRLPNSTITFPSTSSPKGKPYEGRPRKLNHVGQWSSQDLVNPHVSRGMKGAIEWPQRIQKNGLKTRVLEGRMESQIAQLRSVFKRKAK